MEDVPTTGNIPVENESKGNPWKKVWIALGVLLVVVLGVSVYEYFRITPRNVRFTNVTSSSVTVSWNTKSPTSATAMAFKGDTSLPLTVFGLGGERFYDTRDVKIAELNAASEAGMNRDDLSLTMGDFQTEIVVEDTGEYYTHHVTITGLESETEYSFMVGDRYLFRKVKDVGGNAVVSTSRIPEEIKSPVPAYGTVKDAKGENVPIDQLEVMDDGVVYVNYFDTLTKVRSNLFSGVLNSNGNWYVDLSNAKDSKGNYFLETYDTPDENVVLEITVDGGRAGLWQTRQFSYLISPVPDIVINVPNSVQDLDVEGSVVPVDITEVKGESTDIFAVLIDGAREAACESNGLGTWTGSSCRCVRYAEYLEGSGICKCISGYHQDKSSCVVNNPVNPPAKDCLSCTPPDCQGDYPLTSCPNGKECDSKSVSCTSYYSDDSGKCDTNSRKCYKIKSDTRKLADPPCTFLNYCSCVYKYTDGSNSYPKTVKCDENTCGKAIYDLAKSRRCVDVLLNERDRENAQESLKCAGGVEVGKTTYYDGICKKCTVIMDDTNSYYNYAKWVDASKDYEYDGSGCVPISSPEESTKEPVCGPANGMVYSERTLSVKRGDLCASGVPEPNKDIEFSASNQVTWQCVLNGITEGCSASRKEETGGSVGIYPWESCAQLDDFYNLDVCVPVVGETRCVGKAVTDSYGYKRACFHKLGVKESNTLTIRPTPIPTIGPAPTPTIGPAPTSSLSGIEVQNLISLKEHPTIPAGTQCPERTSGGEKVEFCNCNGGVDNYRYPGEWCRETKLSPSPLLSTNPEWRICKEKSKEGQVCSKNGTTCRRGINPELKIEGLFCNGPSPAPASLNLPEKDSMGLFSLNKDVKGVYAQEQGIQYLLDSETGMFVNLPLGVYVVEYEGQTYSVRVDTSGEGVQTLLYMDTNGNGQYDEGVDTNLGENAAVLNISPVELVYNYFLKEGFNFVAFPFLIQTDYDLSSAAALLLELNERYDNAIYSISKYDGRWKIVGQNTELYDANDFQLLPGQGYVIKAKEDVSIALTGQPVKYETTTDTAPITLFEGWNLIGLYGTGVKTYTASSMIADINASNFTADNVTKWAGDKQMYEGFQFSEGQEYGFDFPINSLESYFVRILEGRGNWQPKLRTQ